VARAEAIVPMPMTAQQAREAAAAEGLQLVAAANATGFKGVSRSGKRFAAVVGEGGRTTRLGTFDTAEEAALYFARRIGAEAAAVAAMEAMEAVASAVARAEATVPMPMTAQQAREAAAAEGLQLVAAANATGFKGVRRYGKRFTSSVSTSVSEHGRLKTCLKLKMFDTAEEAALCYARRIGAEAVS
jgi:hypothetical protein